VDAATAAAGGIVVADSNPGHSDEGEWRAEPAGRWPPGIRAAHTTTVAVAEPAPGLWTSRRGR
jgi:hypothetical protein